MHLLVLGSIIQTLAETTVMATIHTQATMNTLDARMNALSVIGVDAYGARRLGLGWGGSFLGERFPER